MQNENECLFLFLNSLKLFVSFRVCVFVCVCTSKRTTLGGRFWENFLLPSIHLTVQALRFKIQKNIKPHQILRLNLDKPFDLFKTQLFMLGMRVQIPAFKKLKQKNHEHKFGLH